MKNQHDALHHESQRPLPPGSYPYLFSKKSVSGIKEALDGFPRCDAQTSDELDRKLAAQTGLAEPRFNPEGFSTTVNVVGSVENAAAEAGKGWSQTAFWLRWWDALFGGGGQEMVTDTYNSAATVGVVLSIHRVQSTYADDEAVGTQKRLLGGLRQVSRNDAERDDGEGNTWKEFPYDAARQDEKGAVKYALHQKWYKTNLAKWDNRKMQWHEHGSLERAVQNLWSKAKWATKGATKGALIPANEVVVCRLDSETEPVIDGLLLDLAGGVFFTGNSPEKDHGAYVGFLERYSHLTLYVRDARLAGYGHLRILSNAEARAFLNELKKSGLTRPWSAKDVGKKFSIVATRHLRSTL